MESSFPSYPQPQDSRRELYRVAIVVLLVAVIGSSSVAVFVYQLRTSELNTQVQRSSGLDSQNANLQNQLNQLHTQVSQLQSQVSQLQTPYRYQLTNPPNAQSVQPPNTPTPSTSSAHTTWNSCGGSVAQGCNITATGLELVVPDTYDYFVSFTSTVPVTVYFFTLGQFVQFSVCSGNLNCVSGYYDYLSPSTSQPNSVFKLAEGCADYVSIFVSSGSGVIYPNIAVASNPAPYLTGYCAQA